MHFYWRIMAELEYLGEILIFHDPSLLREFTGWVRRHATTLSHLHEEGGILSNSQSFRLLSLN